MCWLHYFDHELALADLYKFLAGLNDVAIVWWSFVNIRVYNWACNIESSLQWLGELRLQELNDRKFSLTNIIIRSSNIVQVSSAFIDIMPARLLDVML